MTYARTATGSPVTMITVLAFAAGDCHVASESKRRLHAGQLGVTYTINHCGSIVSAWIDSVRPSDVST